VFRDEIKTLMSDEKNYIQIVKGWVGKKYKKFPSSDIDYVDYYCNERIKWGGGITVKN
jgi:hypothetical protein